jgi:folylpolyglutamate synthase/dihydropteroate synthase
VERLEQIAQEEKSRLLRRIDLFSAPDVITAIEFARRDHELRDLLCITGSFFIASEAKIAMRQITS